jgi:hypothetical protein
MEQISHKENALIINEIEMIVIASIATIVKDKKLTPAMPSRLFCTDYNAL